MLINLFPSEQKYGKSALEMSDYIKEIESARDIKNLPSLDTFPSAVLAINGRILSYWDGKESMKNWLSDNRILLLL